MDLVFEDAALAPGSSGLTLRVQPGESLAIMGPAASGKTRLARIAAGAEEPRAGKLERPRPIVVAEPVSPRLRPQELGRRRGDNLAASATEVLSDLRLWDHRQTTAGELSPAQAAACELVDPLLSQARLLVLDGHLDRIDPWALEGAFRQIRERLREGAIVVIATHSPEIAARCHHLVVLRDLAPMYCGSVRDLAAARGDRSLTIESERNLGVRALVEPLLVGVSRTDSGFRLQPGPGQEHTARLLREGYGDVRFMVSDPRPISDLILRLLEA